MTRASRAVFVFSPCVRALSPRVVCVAHAMVARILSDSIRSPKAPNDAVPSEASLPAPLLRPARGRARWSLRRY